ncbi:MAG TPA: carboxypeptidase-like regulatory domain-containing protein [Candidatus Acidoferrum sp.]|nr:carboxypeptidase-like regulatory domain-containing protein [Candidatus Acidoferrum sp.]
MRRTHRFFLGVLLLIGMLCGARTYGQGGATGAISGVVVDTTGGSVGGAEVQIIDTRTEQLVRRLPTGSDGSFVAALLPPGTYDVVVNKSGFSEAKAQGIEVRVTETTKVTIALKPGSVSEKVEISAQITTVETSNATTGQSLGTETVRDLPLATQNFQQLLTLSSGAQSELNNSTQLGRGDVRMIVNGQREDNNNYLIEGISATDYNVAELTNTPLPNADVIQEFKVQTSLYDASQGRNGGGNINAVLKGGTRQFHGDVYEFFRNDKLDANDFFLNASGQARPVVRQNLFGGSFGGPVGTEKLGFFFVNYQGTRQRSGLSPGTFISTTIPYIPAADRSSMATLEADCGVPSIDPVVFAILNVKSNQFGGGAGGYLYPAPAVPAGTTPCSPVSFAVSQPGKYTDDQFTANWDHEFHGGSDKVSERFFYSNSETFEPFGAGGLQASLGGGIAASDLNFPYTLPVRDRFLGITETHLFSPTLVNELRFGLVHINNSSINTAPAGATATALKINRPTNSLTNNMYKFTLNTSGFQFGPTPQADQYQEQNNYNFVDTVSWVRGAHVVRVGGEMTFVNLYKLFPQVFNGQLFFSSQSGGLTDFQEFLEGAPTGSFGGGGVFDHNYKQNNFAVFAQDDWKATKNITLNLGLRTELLGAWTDGKCHIGNLESDLTLKGQNPFVYPGCVNTLGVAGLTGSGNGTTFHNQYATGLGPRIGVAYDVFGKHTTTIRAGYGIYFVREDIGAVDQLSFQAPFIPIAGAGGLPNSLTNFFEACSASNPAPQNPWCSSSQFGMTNPNALPASGQLSPSFVGCGSVLQGFVSAKDLVTPTMDPTQSPVYANQAGCNGVGAASIFVLEVPRHFKVPNTQQWNLTIQRSLGRQWVLEAGYVGTHAVHLRDTRDAIESLDATVTPVHVTDVNGKQYTITANTLSNAVARTPTPGLNGYGGYQIFANDAYSHYHSLQATLSRRWSAGYLQAAYTWSKSTDATSTGNPAFNTAFNNESTLDNSRGLSDFDRPHRLVVSYVYDLPFLKNAKGVTHAVLGGWQISGVTTIQSGLPFSIFDTASGTAFILNGSTSTLTADLAPGATIASGNTHGDIHSRINGYLNPTAFARVGVLQANQALCDPNQSDPTIVPNSNYCVIGFGNLGRNIYRGPHQQNWDFSLIKNFRLTERQSLRFTSDFFNIWNHANFANPAVTDVETIGGTSSPFGKIVSTRGVPRLIQFSLRYAF